MKHTVPFQIWGDDSRHESLRFFGQLGLIPGLVRLSQQLVRLDFVGLREKVTPMLPESWQASPANQIFRRILRGILTQAQVG